MSNPLRDFIEWYNDLRKWFQAEFPDLVEEQARRQAAEAAEQERQRIVKIREETRIRIQYERAAEVVAKYQRRAEQRAAAEQAKIQIGASFQDYCDKVKQALADGPASKELVRELSLEFSSKLFEDAWKETPLSLKMPKGRPRK